MTGSIGRHDDRLLDALAAIEPVSYARDVWRVAREGRSPFDGSRGAGRWNPRELSALYCAEEKAGALAEVHFHLSRGQPVFPSRVRHVVWRLGVSLDHALKLLDLDRLAALGVDEARWRELLYERTQEIGAAAAFLGFDGLVAPSARFECANLVIFLDNAAPEAMCEKDSEPVDWAAYRRQRPR